MSDSFLIIDIFDILRLWAATASMWNELVTLISFACIMLTYYGHDSFKFHYLLLVS